MTMSFNPMKMSLSRAMNDVEHDLIGAFYEMLVADEDLRDIKVNGHKADQEILGALEDHDQDLHDKVSLIQGAANQQKKAQDFENWLLDCWQQARVDVGKRDALRMQYSDDRYESRSPQKAIRQHLESIVAAMSEAEAHDLKVGDILVSSWGYDQTNVDFYQVVGVTGASVAIREIASEVESSSLGSDKVMPVKDKFVGDVMKKRVNNGSVKITDGRGRAYPWNGKPQYQTASGWGH